jgi:hypothetical protein
MQLVIKGGLKPVDPAQGRPGEKAPEAPPKIQDFVYRCPHDGATRETPGPCPQCQMALGETHRVPKGTAPEKKDRKIYVCDLHPEEVYDKPGECHKGSCAGMKLEERALAAESKLLYTCPEHPEVVSDKPGTCPRDGKKLQYRVKSAGSRLAETWTCPMHPERTAGLPSAAPSPGAKEAGRLKCPDCGGDMKHVQVEEVLAVPVGAVIDTGVRKVVFVDKGHGTFDAVEVVLGPQAGEYFQVLKGLAAGERVVSAGTFLLDAEARLNPAAGVVYFGASGQEAKK